MRLIFNTINHYYITVINWHVFILTQDHDFIIHDFKLA